MKTDERKPLIGNIIFVAACLAVAWLIADGRFAQTGPGGVLYLADYSQVTGQAGPLSTAQRWAMAWADGLMVVGVVVAGVGLMTWVSTTGIFDTLGYGASVLWDRVTFRNRSRKFYDYKVARAEARKKAKSTRHILIVGVALLAASLICTALFYMI